MSDFGNDNYFAACEINNTFSSVFSSTNLEDVYCILNNVLDDDWSSLISTEWTHNYLVSLNTTKSTGSDGINLRVYNFAAEVIAEPLTHLFNTCILEKRVPSIWKTAHVIPVPKCCPSKLEDL